MDRSTSAPTPPVDPLAVLSVAEIDREVAVLTHSLEHRVQNTAVTVACERRRQALLRARRLAVAREQARARQERGAPDEAEEPGI
jgi:hypothetical protein